VSCVAGSPSGPISVGAYAPWEHWQDCSAYGGARVRLIRIRLPAPRSFAAVLLTPRTLLRLSPRNKFESTKQVLRHGFPVHIEERLELNVGFNAIHLVHIVHI